MHIKFVVTVLMITDQESKRKMKYWAIICAILNFWPLYMLLAQFYSYLHLYIILPDWIPSWVLIFLLKSPDYILTLWLLRRMYSTSEKVEKAPKKDWKSLEEKLGGK